MLVVARAAGTHEVKGGFEYFTSTRVGGNSQTSTGYVFQTDYKLGRRQPARRSTPAGRLIPRFVPGTSRLQTWMPLRGAAIDITTASLFVNDHWTAGAAAHVRPRACGSRACSSNATGDISGGRRQDARAAPRGAPTT